MGATIIYPCGDEGGVIVPPQSVFAITENGLYNIEHFRFVTVDVECGTEPYEGEYEVTPGLNDVVLSTANKCLSQDVTVHAISRVDVPYNGGTAVYIG